MQRSNSNRPSGSANDHHDDDEPWQDEVFGAEPRSGRRPSVPHPAAPEPPSATFLHKLREEVRNLHPRELLARTIVRGLPRFSFNRVRTQVLRVGGLQLGQGTLVFGELVLTGETDWRQTLVVGRECILVGPLHIDLGAPVHIADRVTIGPHTVILTVSHRIGPPGRRAGPVCPAPVHIGMGTWLASRVTVLPGVNIGENAVIAAGSVVSRDIPDNVLAGGVPARVLRELDH